MGEGLEGWDIPKGSVQDDRLEVIGAKLGRTVDVGGRQVWYAVTDEDVRWLIGELLTLRQRHAEAVQPCACCREMMGADGVCGDGCRCAHVSDAKARLTEKDKSCRTCRWLTLSEDGRPLCEIGVRGMVDRETGLCAAWLASTAKARLT